MNANFRRDYLYKFKTGAFKDTELRYLNYDRKTKEYVFIEGSNKANGELAIRVKRAEYIKGRIERLYCIGYSNTDQYLKPKRVKKVLVKVRDIKEFSELEVGKKYKFSTLTTWCIDTDQELLLKEIDRDTAIFEYGDGGEQRLHDKWLDGGDVTCKLVG